MMKTQKWMLLASIILFLGAVALVAFSFLTPYAWAQGPGGWHGRGDGMGQGMMFDGDFGPRFGMGPGGGWGRMMGIGGPENSLVTERISAQGLPQGRGFGFGGDGGGCNHAGMGMLGGRWGGPGNSLVTVAAEQLGLTRDELIAELQAGKTIADVAAEKNVTVDTIVDAVLAPRTDRLNELVANGQLTQEEVDNRLTSLRVDVIEWLNQSRASKNAAPGAEPDQSESN